MSYLHFAILKGHRETFSELLEEKKSCDQDAKQARARNDRAWLLSLKAKTSVLEDQIQAATLNISTAKYEISHNFLHIIGDGRFLEILAWLLISEDCLLSLKTRYRIMFLLWWRVVMDAHAHPLKNRVTYFLVRVFNSELSDVCAEELSEELCARIGWYIAAEPSANSCLSHLFSLMFRFNLERQISCVLETLKEGRPSRATAQVISRSIMPELCELDSHIVRMFLNEFQNFIDSWM